MSAGQHRTLTSEAFFDGWERDGLSVTLVSISARPFVEIRVRSGRTVNLPLADAADLAQAIERVASAYVKRETTRPKP